MQISMPVKTFTKNCIALLLFCGFMAEAGAEWKVDLSRRSRELRQFELQPEGQAATPTSFFQALTNPSNPIQEIVVLNTDKGFVPATIRVREGDVYRMHIVNVNENEKNVSFVMDSFSEHHATYYGKIKTFEIQPKTQGVFSFVCPETSAQGRLVVHSGTSSPTSPEIRRPASQD